MAVVHFGLPDRTEIMSGRTYKVGPWAKIWRGTFFLGYRICQGIHQAASPARRSFSIVLCAGDYRWPLWQPTTGENAPIGRRLLVLRTPKEAIHL